MTWKNLSEDLVEVFGDAHRARGHVRNAGMREATHKIAADFGELARQNRGDGRTPVALRRAERAEFHRYYCRALYARYKVVDPVKFAKLVAGKRAGERERGKRYRDAHKNDPHYRAVQKAKCDRRYAKAKNDPKYVEANRERARSWFERQRELAAVDPVLAAELREKRRVKAARDLAALKADPQAHAKHLEKRRQRHLAKHPPKTKVKRVTLEQLALAAGIGASTLRNRLEVQGMSLAEACATPSRKKGHGRLVAIEEQLRALHALVDWDRMAQALRQGKKK